MLKYIYLIIVALILMITFYISKTEFDKYYVNRYAFVTNVYKIGSGEGYTSFVDFYYYEDSVKTFFTYNMSGNNLKKNSKVFCFKNIKTKEMIVSDNAFGAVFSLFFNKLLNKNIIPLLILIYIINKFVYSKYVNKKDIYF